MVEDLTNTELGREQPVPMEVDTEPMALAKTPFERPAGAQDLPELLHLRAFRQSFPDPIARDRATWSMWDYVVATRKHPGIFERILAAVIQDDQSHYRK